MTYANILRCCDELASCVEDYSGYIYSDYSNNCMPDACWLVDSEGNETDLDALYARRNINSFIVPRWKRYFVFGITRGDDDNLLRNYLEMVSENRRLCMSMTCVATIRERIITMLKEMEDLDLVDNRITDNKYNIPSDTVIRHMQFDHNGNRI